MERKALYSEDPGKVRPAPGMNQDAVRRYGVAVIAVMVAALLRFSVPLEIGERFPFSFFLLAVAFSAVYGGLGPGLFANALSILVANVVFKPTLFPYNPDETPRVFVFAVLGIVITLIVDQFQRANEKLRRSTAELGQANRRLQLGEEELTRLNTQLQHSQQELTHANARLKQSNEDLQTFAYSVSHDLQAPIRTIGTFSEILSQSYQGKLDEEADVLLSQIIAGVRRMSSLVADLLEYSKATHVDTAEMSATDCNQVLKEVLEDCESTIRETGGIITSDSLPTVHADPSRISQVFTNLIGNALKYRSTEPPQVHISAKTENGRCVLSVKDNGIGFDMAYQDRIFKAFERLHSQSDYEGTGIGLAIAKRIVERHGGTIWAESKLGEGSTFYVALPRKEFHENGAAKGH